MTALGALLIAGYVLLSAVGRDTTGYVLFLGGPAMTSLVGAVLARRVKHVQAQVSTVQVAAAVALDDEATAIHQHLAAQDVQLDKLTTAVTPTGGDEHTASATGVTATAPGSVPSGLPAQRRTDPVSAPWPIAETGRRKGV